MSSAILLALLEVTPIFTSKWTFIEHLSLLMHHRLESGPPPAIQEKAMEEKEELERRHRHRHLSHLIAHLYEQPEV